MENRHYDEIDVAPERFPFEPIYLPLTTEQCEELFPGSKGKWKPFTMPLIRREDITPIILDPEECKKHKFTWQLPYDVTTKSNDTNKESI